MLSTANAMAMAAAFRRISAVGVRSMAVKVNGDKAQVGLSPTSRAVNP